MCGKTFEEKHEDGIEYIEVVCKGPDYCLLRDNEVWGQEIGSMDGQVNFENHRCMKREDCGKTFDRKTDEGVEHIEFICEEPRPTPHKCDREDETWAEEKGTIDGKVVFDHHACVRREMCGKTFDKKTPEGIEHIEVICGGPGPGPHPEHCDERRGEVEAEETGSMNGSVNFVHHSCVHREMCGLTFDHDTTKGVEHIEIICHGSEMCNRREGMAWAEEIGSMNGEVNFTNHSCVKREDCGKVLEHKTEKGTEWIKIICEEPHHHKKHSKKEIKEMMAKRQEWKKNHKKIDKKFLQ